MGVLKVCRVKYIMLGDVVAGFLYVRELENLEFIV